MTIGKLFAMTLALFLSHPIGLRAAEWQTEWERTVEAARKEGTVVFATAANAELRKQLEPALKKKFGITLEYVPGRAAEQTAKSVIEQIGSLRAHTARMTSSRFMTSISSP